MGARVPVLLPDAEYTQGSAFKASSSKKAKVTIIEFGVGAAMAALIGELLAVVEPKAVLFLGLAGAVHPSLEVGNFVLPIASVRAEGVTGHFLPPQVLEIATEPIFKGMKLDYALFFLFTCPAQKMIYIGLWIIPALISGQKKPVTKIRFLKITPKVWIKETNFIYNFSRNKHTHPLYAINREVFIIERKRSGLIYANMIIEAGIRPK